MRTWLKVYNESMVNTRLDHEIEKSDLEIRLETYQN